MSAREEREAGWAVAGLLRGAYARGRCRAGSAWAGLARLELALFYFLFSEIHITFEIIAQIGSNQFE